MHDYNWVHRDINVENIFVYKGRGLLGDLEYAKRVDDDSDHLFRTVRIMLSCLRNASNRKDLTGYDLFHGRGGNGVRVPLFARVKCRYC